MTLPPHPPPTSIRPARPRTRGPLPWIVAGALILLVVGLLYLGRPPRDAATPDGSVFDVTIVECYGGGSTVSVGYVVRNNGDRARAAVVEFVFRDQAGIRIGTDTAVVPRLAPGDMTRLNESAYLPSRGGGPLTCAISGVQAR